MDPAGAGRTGAAGGRRPCRPRDGPWHRPHRPARGRADPRPLPRRERGGACSGSGGRAGGMRRRSPRPRRRTGSTSSWSSTGWTPSRRCRLGDHVLGAAQNQHRAYRFDVTDLVRAGETELVVDFAAQLTATEQASVDAAAPGAHQRPPVQRDPQDGLQLRVGLGPGPRDRRHLAGGAGRALAHGPVGRGTDPRDGRRRGRPGRGACRRGSRHRCHVDDPRRLRGTWRRGRGGRRRRDPRRRRPRPGPVVAARLRRTAPLGPAGRAAGRRPGRRRPRPAHRVPQRGSRHHARRRRHAVRVARQRETGAREGRELDPRRLLPAPGRPRPVCDPDRGRYRGGHQPAARLGRRSLRERRLLRRLRRDRRTRLAGLPLRVRRVLRGGAAPRRDRRRDHRGGHPAQPAPQPGRLERQQREPLGLRGLGLAPGARRPHLGPRLLPRGVPRADGAVGPDAAVLAGEPLVVRRAVAPERPDHGTSHLWDVWNRVDYTAYRSSYPAVRGRVRVPGTAGLVDADRRDP